jgi:hypothetical protein
MLPLAQSAFVVHALPLPPPSGLGAHWHVAHPFASVATPLGQAGAQPSAGQQTPAPPPSAGRSQKLPVGQPALLVHPRPPASAASGFPSGPPLPPSPGSSTPPLQPVPEAPVKAPNASTAAAARKARFLMTDKGVSLPRCRTSPVIARRVPAIRAQSRGVSGRAVAPRVLGGGCQSAPP